VVGVPRRRAPPPRRLFVEVYALSQRCAPSSATFRAPVSLARFRASAAAASPPSRITSRRFLASQSSVAPSEICPDENLKRLIGNEIDRVFLPAEASAKLIELPEDFPFEIIDNPGDQAIVLKRELAGERVKAIIYTNFDTDEDVNNDDSHAEYHIDSFKPVIQMVVTVERPEVPVLEFVCNFKDKELAIENMRMLNRSSVDAKYANEGPQFSVLKESIRKSLHGCLEVRGIKDSLHDWLHEYMMCKDEREYVVWLKKMRDFLQK
ncbi:hypothetical protein CFC21_013135, partial [Triticum aestivum]